MEKPHSKRKGVKMPQDHMSSNYTPLKQHYYKTILSWEVNWIRGIKKSKVWSRKKPAIFIDTTCGSGHAPDTKAYGSPILLLAELNKRHYWNDNFHCIVHFIDLREKNIIQLRSYIKKHQHRLRKDIEIHYHIGDNRFLLPEIMRHNDSWRFGFIYNDLSGEIPPFDKLLEFYKHLKSTPFDIVINCAATTIKRRKGVGTVTDKRGLVDYIFPLKKHWLLTKPFGKHQWTMLVGRNIKAVPPKFARAFKDSCSTEGIEYLIKANLTNKEINQFCHPGPQKRVVQLNDYKQRKLSLREQEKGNANDY